MCKYYISKFLFATFSAYCKTSFVKNCSLGELDFLIKIIDSFDSFHVYVVFELKIYLVVYLFGWI